MIDKFETKRKIIHMLIPLIALFFVGTIINLGLIVISAQIEDSTKRIEEKIDSVIKEVEVEGENEVF